jgi:hypothetical protein
MVRMQSSQAERQLRTRQCTGRQELRTRQCTRQPAALSCTLPCLFLSLCLSLCLSVSLALAALSFSRRPAANQPTDGSTAVTRSPCDCLAPLPLSPLTPSNRSAARACCAHTCCAPAPSQCAHVPSCSCFCPLSHSHTASAPLSTVSQPRPMDASSECHERSRFFPLAAPSSLSLPLLLSHCPFFSLAAPSYCYYEG